MQCTWLKVAQQSLLCGGIALWLGCATSQPSVDVAAQRDVVCEPPGMAGVLDESAIVRVGPVRHQAMPGTFIGVEVRWHATRMMLVYASVGLVAVDPAMDDPAVPIWVRRPPCRWERQRQEQQT